MAIALKNRNFLKLLDYTPEEIQHLIDLAIALKSAKKTDMSKKHCSAKISRLFLKKPLPAPAARLKSPLSTRARR